MVEFKISFLGKSKITISGLTKALHNNIITNVPEGMRQRTDERGSGIPKLSGCGSVWIERLLWEQEVASSNLVTPS